LIEGNAGRAKRLKGYTEDNKNVTTLEAFVDIKGKNSLDSIIEDKWSNNKKIDLISIDVDGNDYYIFESIKKYLPRVVVVEYNPTIPPHLDILQKEGEYFGCSASKITKLAESKGYKLIEIVGTNCFLINKGEYGKIYNRDYTVEELFPKDFLTNVISSYGGFSFLTNKPAYTSSKNKPNIPKVLSEINLIPVGNILKIRNKYSLKKLRGSIGRYFRFTQRFFNKKNPASQEYKISTILSYGQNFKIKKLIETGTYQGTTLFALRHSFNELYSIELNKKLYEDAKEKFKHYKHIHLLHGDSGEKLKDILKSVKESCVFWLDGHYSGGITSKSNINTPIIKELETIFSSTKRHVVLIDDARCFNGTNDYPTVKTVKDLSVKNNYKFEVKNDIIRIY
jgi:hypothetical protein